jgi:hypothetical protein
MAMTRNCHERAPMLGLFPAFLTVVAGACGAPQAARTVAIGPDLVLELAFDDPVVLAIESQAADGRSWQPVGYLAMPRGNERVNLGGGHGRTDLRITLGIEGQLVDRADGAVVADCKGAITQGTLDHPLDLRGARIATQLQVARGTIATIGLTGASTTTATRAFGR